MLRLRRLSYGHEIRLQMVFAYGRHGVACMAVAGYVCCVRSRSGFRDYKNILVAMCHGIVGIVHGLGL